MKAFINEFKEFINKGNVMDMAVGVVIGGAFTAIVTSLVDDVIMPIVGILIGGINVSDLSIVVGTATLKYGIFLQNVINVLIVAFVVFCVIKALNAMKSKVVKKEEEPAEPEPIPEDIQLLTEIRDLLKKN